MPYKKQSSFCVAEAAFVVLKYKITLLQGCSRLYCLLCKFCSQLLFCQTDEGTDCLLQLRLRSILFLTVRNAGIGLSEHHYRRYNSIQRHGVMQRCGIHAVSCTSFLLYGSVAVLYQLLIKQNRCCLPDRLEFHSELTLLRMLLRRSLRLCNHGLQHLRLNTALVQRNAAVTRRNRYQVRLDFNVADSAIGIIFEGNFT